MQAKIPPGPRGLEVFTGSMRFARNPLKFMYDVWRKYGDAVRLLAPGGGSFYLFLHPDQIEEILVKKNAHFRKDIFTRQLGEILGSGLLTADGEHWLRQRRLIQPSFNKERVYTYAPFMIQYAAETAASWKPGSVISLGEEMMALTLRIIVQAMFQMEAGDLTPRVAHALEAVMRHQAFRLKFPAPLFLTRTRLLAVNRRYQQALGELDDIINQIRSRADSSGTSLLSALSSARDESGSMSDRQIRDELMTILLAGHETTANALSWTFILLAQNPAACDRLIEEVRSHETITLESLYSLPYTEAILKESMRLYPPAWSIGREVTEPCEIGGYPLEPGTQVGMMQYITHRDPRFFPNPDRFEPERWLEGREIPKFAFFPFGGGQRLCVGTNFAMMEASLVLARISKDARLRLDPSSDIRPFPSITLRPRGPVRMKVEPL